MKRLTTPACLPAAKVTADKPRWLLVIGSQGVGARHYLGQSRIWLNNRFSLTHGLQALASSKSVSAFSKTALAGGMIALSCLAKPADSFAGSFQGTTAPYVVLPTSKPAEPPSVAAPTPDPVGVCNASALPDPKTGEAIIRAVAVEESFPSDMLLAIARQESGFNMGAVSGAGAVGIMQLMPDTARRFQVDICDPKDNVRGAIRYLRVLLKEYDNPIYVLAAYNAGEAAVSRNKGIPLYPETVRYVAAVLTDLYGWKPLNSASRTIARPPSSSSVKPVVAAPATPKDNWSQGFVLHME